MKKNELYTLGIDIGSTTVKIAVLGADNEVLFSDYERHLQIYRKHCLIFSDVPSINWDRSMFLLLSPDPEG